MTEIPPDIHIGPHRILIGDVRERLRDIPDNSVHCCVTSPPYFGLRDYGVTGQIGLEPTLADYIATMVDVFREVRRVLRQDGTVWLNIGDSYANTKEGNTNGTGATRLGESKGETSMLAARRYGESLSESSSALHKRIPDGLKPKDLMMVPARLAIALVDDGWWLRSEIVWAKKNCMPESVTDRPTSANEKIFLLAKSPRYYYDANSVVEPVVNERQPGQAIKTTEHYGAQNGGNTGLTGFLQRYHTGDAPTTRNLRNVWHLAKEPFPESHFAVFPTEIPRRAIKAGCPEGGIVLDPFLGSGTTMLVAEELNRVCVGIELNPEYAAMAARRVGPHRPRLALEVA